MMGIPLDDHLGVDREPVRIVRTVEQERQATMMACPGACCPKRPHMPLRVGCGFAYVGHQESRLRVMLVCLDPHLCEPIRRTPMARPSNPCGAALGVGS